MSGYIGTQPVPQATQTRDSFTCTAGQTSFATSGYTPNFLDVYLNGVKLTATDYTASNGSDVVLASGAATGDVLEVVAFTTFDVVTDTITAAGTALTLDRTGSAGTILDLKKDGSTVGSIGIESGGLTIDGESGHSGLRFGGSDIAPRDNGANVDAGIQLGNNIYRFTDLYLSGGVFLGGVGSSNKLDDYEEGTWTPVIIGSSSSGTYVYSSQIGYYTKVGNMVNVFGAIGLSSITSAGTGDLHIQGFPFNYGSASRGSIGAIRATNADLDTGATWLTIIPITSGSDSKYLIYENGDNFAGDKFEVNKLTGNEFFQFQITYYTS